MLTELPVLQMVIGCNTGEASVRERLSAHEYPREIEFIDELPMTTTGKVRRMDLRQREVDKTSSKN